MNIIHVIKQTYSGWFSMSGELQQGLPSVWTLNINLIRELRNYKFSGMYLSRFRRDRACHELAKFDIDINFQNQSLLQVSRTSNETRPLYELFWGCVDWIVKLLCLENNILVVYWCKIAYQRGAFHIKWVAFIASRLLPSEHAEVTRSGFSDYDDRELGQL